MPSCAVSSALAAPARLGSPVSAGLLFFSWGPERDTRLVCGVGHKRLAHYEKVEFRELLMMAAA
jgi:hypothetical protein